MDTEWAKRPRPHTSRIANHLNGLSNRLKPVSSALHVRVTRWTRRSNKLVVFDASVDLAKKASEEAGAEVMVVMRSPDWGLAHEEQNLPVSIGYSARLDG